MQTTIPKTALVALPDFDNPSSGKYTIVEPHEARVPAFDRSYHFGDSLYEVVRTYDGIPFDLAGHMKRLENSCKLAGFAKIPDFAPIEKAIRDTSTALFKRYGNFDIYARVTLSRGMSDLNIDATLSSDPYAVVFVKKLHPATQEQIDKGIHYVIADRRRNPPQALDPAMKSGNYLNNILAFQEATARGANDALMLSTQGFVTEGTTNNFYIVKDDAVWTAPLSVGILAGITRGWIFEACRREGIDIQERLFTSADVRSASELFMSSSIKEVLGVTTLDGTPFGGGQVGPVTKKLRRALMTIIEEFKTAHKAESLYV